MNDAGNSSSVGTVGGPFATGQPDPGAPNLQIDALNLTCVSNLQAIPPPQTQPGAKTYKMTFNFTSALTKSFSPIVCATHRSNGAVFAVGSLASPGLEVLAEYAVDTYLIKELNNLAVMHQVGDIAISGPYMVPSPSLAELNITVSELYPFISCISALRPSPDFFTGFADLDMRNATGDFFRNVGLLLPGLDAGTDGGQTFNGSKVPIFPKPVTFVQPTLIGIGSVLVAEQ
ncbi:unnamed protein product (mitochondrion) [Plasmodiophora brassicae]|uniref:Spondin domain-containing protein n=1 Tax=Plasmodiophora brassicae TaxID=37360 RepID=A0A0G4IV67_PLABS|nr:hypothetical protein PBRA_001124 [Plasmodiophora brassicae]SPQ97230.1 unnamed protein product [Plasmodiophora brassicae]